MEYSVQAGLLLETLYGTDRIRHGVSAGGDHGLYGILYTVSYGSL